jgi:hypothetical protein
MDLNEVFNELIPGGVGALLAFTAFWVGVGRKIVTKDEMMEVINNQSPYSKDRSYIMERLENHKEHQQLFSEALQRNADVMNELRINIVALSKTLEALEYRIERIN